MHVCDDGNEDGENVTGTHVVCSLVGCIGYVNVHHLSQVRHHIRRQGLSRNVLETKSGCTNPQPQPPLINNLQTKLIRISCSYYVILTMSMCISGAEMILLTYCVLCN